jgi:hypothetical protein
LEYAGPQRRLHFTAAIPTDRDIYDKLLSLNINESNDKGQDLVYFYDDDPRRSAVNRGLQVRLSRFRHDKRIDTHRFGIGKSSPGPDRDNPDRPRTRDRGDGLVNATLARR